MYRKLPFILLAVIVLFSFSVRIWRFTEPNHYYFDEVYHAVTAKAYADNNPAPYDPFSPAPKEGTAYDWLHPPLAKLIQAGAIKLFGDNPVGWRLPSVIFGTALIVAVFILALLLFNPIVAIFAASVIALENLTLVMSRITMNDIILSFFVVTSFIFVVLYIRHNKWLYLLLTCLFLGFSVSTKWPGVYAVGTIFLFVVFLNLKKKKVQIRNILLLLIPALLYLFIGYGQYWLQGHTVKQFIDLHKQIWWYQNRHDLEHGYGTTPLYCVPQGLNGPKTWCPWVLDVRGVYFSYEQYGDRAGYIYALGNPAIFWLGILAISYLLGKFIEERKTEYLLPVFAYFVFWVPWVFSPRIMFLYHYLPSIPFLSIALGYILYLIYKTKFKVFAFVILAIFAGVFLYLFPISTGYPIPVEAISKFMLLPTWR